jgi:peptidoglycan hydrolase CwlO-like protein
MMTTDLKLEQQLVQEQFLPINEQAEKLRAHIREHDEQIDKLRTEC